MEPMNKSAHLWDRKEKVKDLRTNMAPPHHTSQLTLLLLREGGAQRILSKGILGQEKQLENQALIHGGIHAGSPG